MPLVDRRLYVLTHIALAVLIVGAWMEAEASKGRVPRSKRSWSFQTLDVFTSDSIHVLFERPYGGPRSVVPDPREYRPQVVVVREPLDFPERATFIGSIRSLRGSPPMPERACTSLIVQRTAERFARAVGEGTQWRELFVFSPGDPRHVVLGDTTLDIEPGTLLVVDAELELRRVAPSPELADWFADLEAFCADPGLGGHDLEARLAALVER